VHRQAARHLELFPCHLCVPTIKSYAIAHFGVQNRVNTGFSLFGHILRLFSNLHDWTHIITLKCIYDSQPKASYLASQIKSIHNLFGRDHRSVAIQNQSVQWDLSTFQCAAITWAVPILVPSSCSPSTISTLDCSVIAIDFFLGLRQLWSQTDIPWT